MNCANGTSYSNTIIVESSQSVFNRVAALLKFGKQGSALPDLIISFPLGLWISISRLVVRTTLASVVSNES